MSTEIHAIHRTHRRDPSHRENLLEVISESFAFSRGRALPLNATREREGINCSLFSQRAPGVTLVLSHPEAAEPVAEFPFDSGENRTGNVQHAFVTDIDPGIEYGYRVSRDEDLDEPAHRFDPSCILLDPYADPGHEQASTPRGFYFLQPRSTVVHLGKLEAP